MVKKELTLINSKKRDFLQSHTFYAKKRDFLQKVRINAVKKWSKWKNLIEVWTMFPYHILRWIFEKYLSKLDLKYVLYCRFLPLRKEFWTFSIEIYWPGKKCKEKKNAKLVLICIQPEYGLCPSTYIVHPCCSHTT